MSKQPNAQPANRPSSQPVSQSPKDPFTRPAENCTLAVSRDMTLPGNRFGQYATGLYPNVSRTKLSKLLGKHISTVTSYLQGRVAVPFPVALVMAKALRVNVEDLNRDLKKKQGEYKELQAELAKGKTKARS